MARLAAGLVKVHLVRPDHNINDGGLARPCRMQGIMNVAIAFVWGKDYSTNLIRRPFVSCPHLIVNTLAIYVHYECRTQDRLSGRVGQHSLDLGNGILQHRHQQLLSNAHPACYIDVLELLPQLVGLDVGIHVPCTAGRRSTK